KNPSKIAFGNGIFALSNHFLTTSAVDAQVCVNQNQCHKNTLNSFYFSDPFRLFSGKTALFVKTLSFILDI
ncbi:MAG: hypothetical protein K2O16_15330, partial [Lachnospiraceae bacterium]|nr:hypothetical protein [Lachnospiraceae bacterium]